MIMIFAPAGIGEVRPGDDLATMINSAVAADENGPLQDGDIIVVTSKIISKQQGRILPAQDRAAAIRSETVRTVARKGPTAIVETRHGVTMAAAGVDNSNVDSGFVLLLPTDSDATAAALHDQLARTGVRVGVIISDTAGRAWRNGQTDFALGAAGVRVLDTYAGRNDGYGNELQVTAIALADELAAAADLVKSKLSARPVAVVRGLAELVDGTGQRARDLVRPADADLFRQGTREAVISAVLAAVGQSDRYEEWVNLDDDTALIAKLRDTPGLSADRADLLEAVLGAAGVKARDFEAPKPLG